MPPKTQPKKAAVGSKKKTKQQASTKGRSSSQQQKGTSSSKSKKAKKTVTSSKNTKKAAGQAKKVNPKVAKKKTTTTTAGNQQQQQQKSKTSTTAAVVGRKRNENQNQNSNPNDINAETVRKALQLAVTRLRVGTTTPVGRQQQRDQVFNFVSNQNVVSNVMQLFGCPGSGKTAVVKHTLSIAPSSSTCRNVALTSVFLNGFLLQKPGELYCRLWQHLSKIRNGNEQLLVPEAAAAALEQTFRDRGWLTPKQVSQKINTSSNSSGENNNFNQTSQQQSVTMNPQATEWRCIIVIDEVDKLYESAAGIRTFFRLLEWLELPHCHCRLITMANSMQLPETVKTRSRVSTSSHQRVVFGPYQKEELKDILKDRLSGIVPVVFSEMVMEGICNTIASQNGDVRRLLQTCSVAIHEMLSRADDSAAVAGHNVVAPQSVLAYNENPFSAIPLPLPKQATDGIITLGLMTHTTQRLLQDRLREIIKESMSPLQRLALVVLTIETWRCERDKGVLTLAKWRDAATKALNKFGNQIGLQCLKMSFETSDSNFSFHNNNSNSNNSNNNNNKNKNLNIKNDSSIPESDWMSTITMFREVALIEVTVAANQSAATGAATSGGVVDAASAMAENSVAAARTSWDLSYFSNPLCCHVVLLPNVQIIHVLAKQKFPEMDSLWPTQIFS